MTDVYLNARGFRRHVAEWIDMAKWYKRRKVGPTSVLRRGNMPVRLGDVSINGSGKVTPPPDVPFLKLPHANVTVFRVGYCTSCAVPIFSKNKEDKLDRCHLHSDDSSKWARWPGKQTGVKVNGS